MPAKQPLVTCPKCQNDFPITDALTSQLVQPLLPGLREEAAAQVRAGLADDLEAMRCQNEELTGVIKERDAQVEQFRKDEAQLRRDRRALEEAKGDLERKTEQMRDEITAEVRKQEQAKTDKQVQRLVEKELRGVSEEHQTEVHQLREQLERVNRELAETQRKTRTGSQTEEGYARQELFKHELAARFPHDLITMTPRGQAGADVTQLVRSGSVDSGTILWEVKRAANWQAGWTAKLAADMNQAGAHVGVIVTESLPPGMDGFGQYDGVWVSGFGDATALAGVLREIVMTAWKHETAAAARAGNAEKVYNYVMTGAFARRYERLGRLAEDLLHDIHQDKRALDQRWKRTERRIQEILDVRDAIPLDLQDAIDADTELPAALRAEIFADDMPLELTASTDD
jgi:hypothetical protein